MGPIGIWAGIGSKPSLSSVAQVGPAVRVVFTEAMTNNADFQDPLNYTITPMAGGDVVTINGATPGPGATPTYVDLTLIGTMTGGSSYQIAADISLIDAAGNPMDPAGLTLNFLGFGISAVTLGDLGIIEALTGVFGEEMAEVGGFRMTRLTAAVNAGGATFYGESFLEWETTGTVSLDGVVYTYTSRTDVSLIGITHVAGGAAVAGAAANHRIESTVVDLERAWSGLDLLRRGFLVNYAVEEDLNALGRNLGVNRPPIFTDDDQFRKMIKAVAYNPKGTVLGLELALEALVGAGNYEIYEDLIQYPNTVFIRVDTSAFIVASEVGRAFLNPIDWDGLSGSADTLVIGETPLAVSGVTLKDLGELFDFRDDIPSDVMMELWPGGPPISPWVYGGTEAEGAAVINVAGEYTKFLSPTVGTAFYLIDGPDGGRVTPESFVETSMLVTVPTGATLGASFYQFVSQIYDGAVFCAWGLVQGTAGSLFKVTLFGASALGVTVELDRDIYHEIALKKFGTDRVELWVDGALESSVPYASFPATTTHQVRFGVSAGVAGLEVRVKQLGVFIHDITDYWGARGALGTVATANPDQFDDGEVTPILGAGDVGKYLTIRNSGITNAQGGNNNGHFLIGADLGGGLVTLVGPETTDAATTETTNPNRITMDDEEAFQFPDDLGKAITISGSALGNDGTYAIDKLLEPGTLSDLESYDTPISQRTGICEVVAGGFVSEQNLEYRLGPAFETEAGLDWELSDAGSFVAATLTLRQALWTNGLVMEVRYTNVLSAQLLENEDIDNTVTAGPDYAYYPFYLADPFGLVQAYMDDLTAAGVIPEFEPL